METEAKHPIAAYRAKHSLTLRGFADLIGVQKAIVSKWENRQQNPSIENAIAIERATGGDLPRHELRPDVWQQTAAAE